jgi:hypothetical protein
MPQESAVFSYLKPSHSAPYPVGWLGVVAACSPSPHTLAPSSASDFVTSSSLAAACPKLGNRKSTRPTRYAAPQAPCASAPAPAALCIGTQKTSTLLRQSSPKPSSRANLTLHMSEQPAATTSDLVPALPNLEVFNEWEAWRIHCLGQLKLSRLALGQMALATGTELGVLRASTVLAVEEGSRAESGRLAMLLMRSTDPLMRLWGKFQLAYMKMLAGYTAGNDPELSGLGVVAVLQGILEDLNGLTDTRLLSFELQLRLSNALADAFILADRYSEARKHAAECLLLAEQLGVDQLVNHAKYQLARIEYWEGSVTETINVLSFMKSAKSNFANSVVHLTSLGLYADALHFLGNTDEALRNIDYLRDYLGDWSGQVRAAAFGIQVFSLRNTAYFTENNLIEYAANDAKPLISFWLQCATFFSLHPNKKTRRTEIAHAMRLDLRSVQSQFQSWSFIYVNILAAYASMLAGDLGIAQRSLPSMEKITQSPPWVRCLGFAVTLEVYARTFLPGSGKQMLDAMQNLLASLLDLDNNIEHQVAEFLALLTPLSTSMLSLSPDCPPATRHFGSQAILNMETRPVSVYGSAKLSPVQASDMLLSWLGYSASQKSNLSKKNLDDFESTFLLPFYDHCFWREAVPAAILAYLYVSIAHESRSREFYIDLAKNAIKKYGTIPLLKDEMAQRELGKIYDVIDMLISQRIDLDAARKLLFHY